MSQQFLAVVNGEVVPVEKVPGNYRAFIHWTVDYAVELLVMRVVAWSPDHTQHFEYRFDEHDPKAILALLPMLAFDANWRLSQ